ncbi:MAG: hypothetical protein ACJ0P7_01815 [Flavobacteriaceae bacterium]|jgi:hypothetical protein|tara:strand:- start:280 stop:678 length:399 start_codon:yes stop_codon:yes gene_type:complete
MKNALILLIIPVIGFSQILTDKDSYSIDVTDFEIIEIVISTNALKRVKVTGDGYDEVFLSKGAQIKDRDKLIIEKVPEFIKREAFWKAFLGRCGFEIQDTKTEKKVNKTEVAKYLPGAKARETTLTFVKKNL